MNDNNKNGKIIKVFTNEFKFGQKEREVYLFGLFRCIKNNTIYVIYADIKNDYNLVYFATCHVRENILLTLEAKKEEDILFVKEYIYKVTNREVLDSFELIDTSNITTIEIIDFNKLELKPEIISLLIENVIPKEVDNSNMGSNVVKKKVSYTKYIIILLIFGIGFGIYSFFSRNNNDSEIVKNITCIKEYSNKEIGADIEEDRVLSFNNRDELKKIDVVDKFVFNDEDSFLNFINKGVYFKYMTNDSSEDVTQDTNNYTFTISRVEMIDINYLDATGYEEVLINYRNNKYKCKESINE